MHPLNTLVMYRATIFHHPYKTAMLLYFVNPDYPGSKLIKIRREKKMPQNYNIDDRQQTTSQTPQVNEIK